MSQKKPGGPLVARIPRGAVDQTEAVHTLVIVGECGRSRVVLNQRQFSLDEIKAAFWTEFCGMGDVYFGNRDDGEECTLGAWTSFVEHLNGKHREGCQCERCL